MAYANRRERRRCPDCQTLSRWCRFCHGPHCQCPGKTGDHKRRNERKYPKWGFVFVTDPRTGRSRKGHPRWWAQLMSGRTTLDKLRAEGRQGCFDSATGAEIGKKGAKARWKGVRVNRATGKRIVKVATARWLQKRRTKQTGTPEGDTE